MIEFIGMSVLCLVMWFFAVGPCIFGVLLGIHGFSDSVKINAVISAVLMAFVLFVFAFVMCVNFISGDPQPVTTFINGLSAN